MWYSPQTASHCPSGWKEIFRIGSGNFVMWVTYVPSGCVYKMAEQSSEAVAKYDFYTHICMHLWDYMDVDCYVIRGNVCDCFGVIFEGLYRLGLVAIILRFWLVREIKGMHEHSSLRTSSKDKSKDLKTLIMACFLLFPSPTSRLESQTHDNARASERRFSFGSCKWWKCITHGYMINRTLRWNYYE